MNDTMRILLIEDDEDDYVITKKLLASAFGTEHELQWIQTYAEAIPAIHENNHDVYLLDRHLGPDDGLELVQKLNEINTRNSPVILLTGRDDHETDLAAMQAGAIDYLVKQQLTAPLIERTIRYAVERKKVEQRLLQLAHFDPLTELANRTLFQIRLQDGINQAKRAGQMLAVLLLDLDHFKEINDTYGHPMGDALLREVALRLTGSVRESDTVSRLGGDEFAVTMPQLNTNLPLSSIAYKLLKKLAQPYQLGDMEFCSSVSLGVAVYPTDGDNPEELLKHADLALYQAKNAGRNTYSFYDAELDALARVNKAMKVDIETGILQKQFCLFYQPIVSAQTTTVESVEALVRWKHPEKGWVQPDQFIPLAETSGLIVPLGTELLRIACQQIKRWQEMGSMPGRLAVNISPRQLRDDSLIQVIETSGIDPQYLEFEVTENVLIESESQEVALLTRIHEMGVTISIDDFGTGYSSLGYLKQLPVKKLKIDRSFVCNINSNHDDASIVRAVIMLSHALNLEVVAEGVETKEQFAFLREERCDLIQGYLIARPMPVSDFDPWYQQHLLKSVTLDATLRGRNVG